MNRLLTRNLVIGAAIYLLLAGGVFNFTTENIKKDGLINITRSDVIVEQQTENLQNVAVGITNILALTCTEVF